MICGIYEIVNLLNGHHYIGSSNDVEDRLRHHRNSLRRGVEDIRKGHHSIYLQNAWNKYGEEHFDFVLLVEVPEERLIEVEQMFIDTYNPEYNMCKVAGRVTGLKGIKKPGVSKADKGRKPWNKGKKVEALNGNQHAKGNTFSLTPEQRAKVSASKTGKKRPDVAKRNRENGEKKRSEKAQDIKNHLKSLIEQRKQK